MLQRRTSVHVNTALVPLAGVLRTETTPALTLNWSLMQDYRLSALLCISQSAMDESQQLVCFSALVLMSEHAETTTLTG